MIDLFAPEIRRNPWPVYDQLRVVSPVLHVPPPFNGWMVFDYDTVKWIMTDHASRSKEGLLSGPCHACHRRNPRHGPAKLSSARSPDSPSRSRNRGRPAR